jgi:hypothetical protein
MTTELKELKNIILTMDEMIGYWFDGTRPEFVECEATSIYEIADDCRNRALEILEKMENKG